MIRSVLWEFPAPSSGFLDGGPRFEKRQGRVVAVCFLYELEDGDEKETAVVFEGVEAFKCTYMTALEPFMLEAYDKLVDRGDTDWLGAVRAAVSTRGPKTDSIRHVMINFDDGPCYEVICRSFRIETPE